MNSAFDKNYMNDILKKAKKASEAMNDVDGAIKNKALLQIAKDLVDQKDIIMQMNRMDIDEGTKNGLSKALIDRLTLSEERIRSMSAAVLEVAAFKDPIGEVLDGWRTENGLSISKVRVPIGVIGMIFESRPNVTVDAAALAIKSSNVIILRGGKEALNSNMVLSEVVRAAIRKVGMSEDCVQMITGTDRELVTQLITANEYVDCIIPRGGRGLKKAIMDSATVPVIETGAGLCHLYIHQDADIDMAINIAINAKTQRTGVCNAIECILVHEKFSGIKALVDSLLAKGVEIRGNMNSLIYSPDIKRATDEDYHTEYLDMIVSLKIVKDIDEAIEHINSHGTKHSEAIVTKDVSASERFLNRVDASTVYVNASTRFTDGGEFGFGGEIGISTQKLHARGPMGVRELTTTKYVVRGNGQIR